MPVLENIELCNNEYAEARIVYPAQKIKLRNSSYVAISGKYIVFNKDTNSMANDIAEPTVTFPKNINIASNDMTKPMEPSQQATAEITEVIAVNPIIAEMVNLLEIKGKINSVAYKALKIKPMMYDGMKKSSASKKTTSVAPAQQSQELAIEPVKLNVEEGLPLPAISTPTPVVAENDAFKISKNGASAAKIEKYTVLDDKQPKSIELESPSTEKQTVSFPALLEEQSARPVSREVPLIAPERPIEPEKKELVIKPAIEEKKNIPENSANLSIDITNLEQLKEYLAKTAQLKMEAEQAKNKETEAKARAERAEQEAANIRDELVKTAERVAAHQESLIAQTAQSNAQVSMYEAKCDEFVAERNEYQKAISDMLAIMGDDTKTGEKVM